MELRVLTFNTLFRGNVRARLGHWLSSWRRDRLT